MSIYRILSPEGDHKTISQEVLEQIKIAKSLDEARKMVLDGEVTVLIEGHDTEQLFSCDLIQAGDNLFSIRTDGGETVGYTSDRYLIDKLLSRPVRFEKGEG